MSELFFPILESFWSALGGAAADLESVRVTGAGDLPSAFPVTDFACAAVAAAAAGVRELSHARSGSRPAIEADRRLTSFWYAVSIRPSGWTLPAPRDPMTGDYSTRDGWIRLHTNAPHHRAAAERVLGRKGDEAAVARAVAGWSKTELESAIVAAGGCAAEMRSAAEWLEHPQGRAVMTEPLVHGAGTRDSTDRVVQHWTAERPLSGVRVLDLTRVLAGPVSTRFLAGYGAEVLRIDPPGWDEPGVVPEVTLGKRCTRLDLRTSMGRERFTTLLRQADVLVHGYRPKALAALGFDEETVRRIAPGLIDVSLDAYGWQGPWCDRRGFDSLVQMSSGIAATGMAWRGADRPTPLPVQALDHSTGYLMAAAVCRGLTQRRLTGHGYRFRLSLARTAKALMDWDRRDDHTSISPECEDDADPVIEDTSWGPARRLKPPVAIAGTPLHWTQPATALGTAAARWTV
jgi:crotonobetainyl-CoA:carnitine CoA-transferase CaiB-like acyl-CoA transferase